MTKYLLFSDLHYHKWTRFSVPDETYLTTRLKLIHDSVVWVGNQILTEKPDCVVLCGDLVHSTKLCGFDVYNILYEDMCYINYCCIKVGAEFNVLSGNHDMIGKSLECGTANLPLDTLSKVNLREVDITDCNGIVRYLPYTKIKPRYLKTRLTFTHIDVIENIIGSKSLGSWSIDDIGSKYIFSGHYHVPCSFSSDHTEFVYVGSLLPHSFSDFSDKYSDHGVVIVEDIGEDLTWHRVSNPNSIPFIKIYAESKDQFITNIYKYPVKSYWSINVPMELEEFAIDTLIDYAGGSIHYEFKPLSLSTGDESLQLDISVDTLSDVDLLTSYINKYKCDSDLDVGVLRDLGITLMHGKYDLKDYT